GLGEDLAVGVIGGSGDAAAGISLAGAVAELVVGVVRDVAERVGLGGHLAERVVRRGGRAVDRGGPAGLGVARQGLRELAAMGFGSGALPAPAPLTYSWTVPVFAL